MAFIKGAAKAGGGGPLLESAQGAIASRHAALILPPGVIQVGCGPGRGPGPEGLPNDAWVSVVAIGGAPVGRHAGHGPGRAEESLSGREVSGMAEPCVNQVAVSVNR